MAIVIGTTAAVRWTMNASMSGNLNENPNTVPDVVLEPFRLAAYDLDPYRLRAGWPQQTPDFDVHADTSISAEGAIMDFRPDPTGFTTGAAIRWVASQDSYDPVAGTWTPMQSAYGDSQWLTGPEYAPSLDNEVEYRIGKDFLVRDALNFSQSAGEHMWSDFDATLTGSFGFTVIMVLALRSSFNVTNADDPEYAGLLYPGRATPSSTLGDTFDEVVSDPIPSLQIRNGSLWVQPTPGVPFHTMLDVASLQLTTEPGYVAYSVGYPEIRVYAGQGPGTMKMAKVPSPQRPQSMSMVLGRTTGDLLHPANMLLFDIGIYNDQLSAVEVATEVALLAAAYGGGA